MDTVRLDYCRHQKSRSATLSDDIYVLISLSSAMVVDFRRDRRKNEKEFEVAVFIE